MAAIDAVKAHFSRLATRRIEVPEWGADGAPLVLFAAPVTLAEMATLREIGDRDGPAARAAHTLVVKARDAEGKPLFTIEDKRALMNSADWAVVTRVVAEIMAAPTVEDAAGN